MPASAPTPCLRPYRPRAAEHTVLHQVVRLHLATFLRVAEEAGGVPAFVERELRQFLTCGVWAKGFARFRCDACHAERLVPFSCKARAVCPSCGGRRMAERAAHLVDHVLPAVPMRQWVLSLPFRLRYVLAFDHALCRKVLAVHVRALRAFYRRRARRQGIADGETGAVTAIQRWGSALNLNVHFHTLALDGVFQSDADGDLRFVPASPPTPQEIARLVATIARRVATLLRRHGLTLGGDEPADDADSQADAGALAALAAASVTGRSLLGAAPGARVGRVGRTTTAAIAKAASPWHARAADFDLHGGRTVRAEDRRTLERLCHYLLRPPLAQDRLELLPDGRVGLTLAHPWADGTSVLVFGGVEFLEKLAVLIPKPRVNLVLYHGILGARARRRAAAVAQVVPPEATRPTSVAPVSQETAAPPERRPSRRGWLWADLMRRVFEIDVLACDCGARLRFLATIEDPPVVQRILRHLGLPTDTPVSALARPPPRDDLAFAFPA
ncbi:MAG: transposase [Deltaproteobacteria bacterium]|nr:transposase [Deltaproteobacteria bacterium]